MITVTDLFCGAGGSGLGSSVVPGVQLRIAANHWRLAIETHEQNFPDADHDCADISQVDPRRYPRTDILWASPSCTNHSVAKGVARSLQQPDLFGDTLPNEAAERSRATMWDVPRFAEHHRYRAVIVENVVDAARWVMWPAWLHAMALLGYRHRVVYLNSMHAPAIKAPRAPQSRDRLYVVFTREGDPVPDVEPRPLAWCPQCMQDVRAMQVFKRSDVRWGRYRAQYVYRCPTPRCHVDVEPYADAAATAIDWDLPGQRIGDRDKPLSPKTMARIRAGLEKYGRAMTFEARGNTFVRNGPDGRPVYARAWPIDKPTATLTTTETRALVVPVEGRDGKDAVPVGRPLRTQTTRLESALVVPYYGNTTSAQSSGRPMPTMGTVDTAGVAFIAELRGGRSDHRAVTDPLATVTASGNHHMLIEHDGQAAAPQPAPAEIPTVEECMFRMLAPHEIQAAMAFRPTYQVLGNRREQVRQLGNAVTPPAAEWLIRAVVAALTGEAVTA